MRSLFAVTDENVNVIMYALIQSDVASIAINQCGESVWSVYWQYNERDDQGEDVHDIGQTSTAVWARTWALKKVQEN